MAVSDYFGYGYKNATAHDVLRFYWECTNIDNTNNRSTIKWEMYLTSDLYGKISSTANKNWSVTVNGTKYSGTNKIGIPANSVLTLATGTTVIPHNVNGAKTFSFSFSQEFNITFSSKKIGTITGSGTGELAYIPKPAKIVSAPDFNDEQNPTITYSNPAGNLATSLEACISLTGVAADVPYRAISKTGTSYTFNLTDAERKTLRDSVGLTNGQERDVKFYVKSVVGGKTYYSSLTKRFYYINGNIEIAPETYDSNSKTVALTGNNQRYIKYHSNAKYDINITLKKGATLKSIEVVNSGVTKKTETGEFIGVTERKIDYFIEDNRANNKSSYNILCVPQDFIEYIKPTCNIAATKPTTDGKMIITITGNFFNSSFGAANNEITVEYNYKEGYNDYIGWATIPTTLDGNKYTATVTVEGLDYTKNYTIVAKVTDKLETKSSKEVTVKTLPVYDWGKDDFKFNVPVYDMYGNKLKGIRYLWGGVYYMSAAQTITLREKVTEQTYGIVVVFSRFDATNNKILNEGFQSFFIPKNIVEAFEGDAHTFNLMSADFNYASCKKLYISNESITGDNQNQVGGTGATGISYTNRNYVLRYVYGV